MQAMPCKEKQRQRAENLERVADNNHLPPVEAVRGVSGGQHKQQSGQKECQPRVSKIERAVRNLINEPRNGERLRLCADNDEHARKLVEAKIAGQKCYCP